MRLFIKINLFIQFVKRKEGNNVVAPFLVIPFALLYPGSIFTFSSRVGPAPAPELESRGISSRMVRKRLSDVVVRKSISAFGCKPYKYGLSGGRTSSMY